MSGQPPPSSSRPDYFPKTDNALIAFECIHAIQKTNGEEFYAYKLDLSKAYDHVDWGFLKRLLEKLGFQSQ